MLDLKIPKEKNKPETSKKAQYIPKGTPRAEVVNADRWTKLYGENEDLFEEPGTPVERDITPN